MDYRLSPRYKFPTEQQDAFDAYLWVLENAEQIHIDPQKIAVCGDSAGGNLSAVVCRMAQKQKIQMPCAQELYYPFANMDTETNSMKKYRNAPMCGGKQSKVFNNLFFGDMPEPLEYASLVEAENLEGMPPTYIESAEYDPLLDGAVAYGEKLKVSGVAVEENHTKGTMHGYDIAVDSVFVQTLMKKRVAFLKRYFQQR